MLAIEYILKSTAPVTTFAMSVRCKSIVTIGILCSAVYRNAYRFGAT